MTFRDKQVRVYSPCGTRGQATALRVLTKGARSHDISTSRSVHTHSRGPQSDRLLGRLSGRRAGITIVAAASEETGCEATYDLAARQNVLGGAGALVVAEPNSNYPMLGHKGALWLRGKTRGVTAHGSMPEQGVNAIYAGARAVTRLEGYGFNVAPNRLLGSPTLNVGTFSGGMNVNSVPDEASFTFDMRTIPG